MALASRGSDSSSDSAAASAAATAAAAAAARQMSVDAEAIKIVIHDVDDNTPRRVSLRRDPNDKGHRCKCFNLLKEITNINLYGTYVFECRIRRLKWISVNLILTLFFSPWIRYACGRRQAGREWPTRGSHSLDGTRGPRRSCRLTTGR